MRFKARLLLTWLAASLVLGSTCLFLYLREARQIEHSIRVREADRVALFAQLFGQDFREVGADLRILTENEALKDFLATGQVGSLRRLTREMALMSRHNQEYDKIRFIDGAGKEVVRVNLGGTVEPASALQLKADRYYFRDALRLPAGQVYLSAFDLDVENGAIERPLKPILRFAAPVFDTRGRRRGVVVISYLGTGILNTFQRLAPLYQDRLRVLNDRGFWLRGAHPDDEWGFMLPERASRTLAITAPGVWTEVTAQEQGQSRGLGGLFSWHKVSPANVAGQNGLPARASDESLVIASDTSAASWKESFAALRLRFTIFGVALIILTTVLTFLYGARLQMNERFAAMHRRNTALIHAANIAIVATNTDGMITDFNPTAERLFGWSASDLIGKQTPAVFSDANEIVRRARELSVEFGRTVAPGFDVFALKALRDGVDEREWTGIRKDGQRLPLRLSLSLLPDSQGGRTGYLGIVSDLTIHKQAEQALREATAAAEESARLKSRFLANMSHEIRTPMNGVVGMTELLLETSLTDDQRMLADTVRTSADSLLTIINDILDFSKIEAGQLTFDAQPFDVTEPVEGCLAIMADRASAKGIELAYFVEENVPLRLVGDIGRLHQVLLNLVGNAIKFTTQGEVIVAVTSVSEHDDRARLRFAVRDTGIGLSKEQQAMLFQPFVQGDSATTRKFGGTGLGLAISKQLVSLMGGEIGIESEPDKGSTFWFTVDLPTASADSQATVYQAELAGKRALIVDDNGTNREILRRQLAAWGVHSVTTTGGEPALEALRAAAATDLPYDLVLLDMHMPGMTGLETAQRVRSDSSLSKLKMVILTSMSDALTRKQLDEAGVGMCLTKPVRQSQFHDALVTLIGASLTGAVVPVRRDQVSAAMMGGAAMKLRILVAEDNLVNQHVVRKQLEKAGYEPDIVADGAKAVEAAHSHPYDVIFMDCQMPGLDGFEATGLIREWENQRRTHGETFVPLHIVAITANSMAGDREACLAAGMSDYVSKPLHLNDLAAALARSPVAQSQMNAMETSNAFLSGP